MSCDMQMYILAILAGITDAAAMICILSAFPGMAM